MEPDLASYPDTAKLLQDALQGSWQRDRSIRRWKLIWRWSTWWLTRYGSSVIAAMLVVSSTPALFLMTPAQVAPLDPLLLKPSLQLTLPIDKP
jgi:hypothetical protein